jgi:hypothetical protein
VEAPEQAQAQRPPCFPDPADDYIPLPEGENVALGRPVVSGVHNDVYVIKNVNDGKTDTYWESKGFPAEVTFDLEGSRSVCAAAVCLNPSAIWEPRIQEIAVLVSEDGENYTEVSAPAKYSFDAATGNRIRIDYQQSLLNVPLPVDKDYRFGYDRMRGGMAAHLEAGYLLLNDTRLLNLSVALEVTYARTRDLRDYDFRVFTNPETGLMEPVGYTDPNKRYNDFYYGIRVTWSIPTYERKPQDFYYN